MTFIGCFLYCLAHPHILHMCSRQDKIVFVLGHIIHMKWFRESDKSLKHELGSI